MLVLPSLTALHTPCGSLQAEQLVVEQHILYEWKCSY